MIFFSVGFKPTYRLNVFLFSEYYRNDHWFLCKELTKREKNGCMVDINNQSTIDEHKLFPVYLWLVMWRIGIFDFDHCSIPWPIVDLLR